MEVTQVVRVGERSQAGDARRAAISMARRIGFDESEAGRVGLVVTEAATNLVKHAQDGQIVLGTERRNGTRSLRVLALDQGPGIGSVEDSMRDGVSRAGTMGNGLGAIRRSSSEFDLYSGAHGTILYAAVVSGDAHRRDAPTGVVCAPYPGESVCGDAVAVHHGPSYTTVAVVDGLGHGAGAAEAAEIAIASFEGHPQDGPADIVARMQELLRPTRGAAVAVVRMEHGRRMARYSGIGNVSGVVLGGAAPPRHMVSEHGIVGHTPRPPREYEYPLSKGSIVVLHTDGIAARWNLESYPGLLHRHPMISAGILFRDFRRSNDDATVVVVREAA
jgi:anti-sigma regulatory factor (Ser/Thr protein kinase)